ncbi:MAG TPA: M23 family metallopeptidase [Gaiellaceae bacterium]|nr:M23 family metallopeptidase [Gaiellaceae bacterium]
MPRLLAVVLALVAVSGASAAVALEQRSARESLPAVHVLKVGYAETAAHAPPLEAPSSLAGPGIPAALTAPTRATPRLGESGYIFPVYGAVSFGDTFGAFRPDVSGHWHHGDDLFAPVGAPVLAVAGGIVFSVGWNAVGGWRLWLRDARGNEFYYAHLSAYSPLAVDGTVVHAGDVLAYVGDTGDAEGTPSHLHFEIHPAGLLWRGYDGAVDPTAYLDAWRRAPADIRFEAAAERIAAAGAAGPAPTPGAVLLGRTDISAASGLEPGSLRRALGPSRTGGDGGPLLLRLQPASPAPVRTPAGLSP